MPYQLSYWWDTEGLKRNVEVKKSEEGVGWWQDRARFVIAFNFLKRDVLTSSTLGAILCYRRLRTFCFVFVPNPEISKIPRLPQGQETLWPESISDGVVQVAYIGLMIVVNLTDEEFSVIAFCPDTVKSRIKICCQWNISKPLIR